MTVLQRDVIARHAEASRNHNRNQPVAETAVHSMFHMSPKRGCRSYGSATHDSAGTGHISLVLCVGSELSSVPEDPFSNEYS